MTQEIFEKANGRIFDLAGVELPTPCEDLKERVTLEELFRSYSIAWEALIKIHDISFEVEQTTRLFKTIGL